MKITPIIPITPPKDRKQRKALARQLLTEVFEQNLTLEQAKEKLKGYCRSADKHTIRQMMMSNAPDLQPLFKQWLDKQPKNWKIPMQHDTIPYLKVDKLSQKLQEQGVFYDDYI